MEKRRIIFVCIILMIAFSNNRSMAVNSGSDTLNPISLSNEKILNLKTIWSGSSNAASLRFFDFDGHLGKTYLSFIHDDGDYKLFQNQGISNRYGFFTDGYVKQGKWKFYGNFNYSNGLSLKVKWVDVMEPYNGNSYTVGDSIGGKYWKEYFKMQGKGAYELNSLISLGFDLKYTTGVGTKRKDPRPVNTMTNFDFRPGIIFDLGKTKIGANFRYQEEKEDIDFKTVTDQRFSLFYFKGLGAFSSTFETDSRYTEMSLLGGGLQFVFENNSFRNSTSVNFDKKVTDIKRGSTHPLQIVLLDDYFTGVSSEFIFLPSEKEINRLTLSFSNTKIYGREPVVEPKPGEVNYQWSTVAKYTLYWNEAREYGLRFSHYKLAGAGHIDWGMEVSGKINTDKTTYYFVPEFNRQKYNLFSLDALLEKGFAFDKWESLFTLNGGYRNSFDSSLEIVDDEKLLAGVQTDFINHDFGYYTSGLWQAGASVKIGRMVSIDEAPVQVYLDSSYKLMVSDLSGNPTWKVFEVKLGMNF